MTSTVCAAGYYYSGAGCTAFANAVTTSAVITGCADGYFLDAVSGSSTLGKCVTCITTLTGSTTCSTKDIATACSANYLLTASGKCSSCGSNVATCSEAAAYATSCSTGYKVLNG